MPTGSVDERISAVVKAERALDEQIAMLRNSHKTAFEEMQKLEDERARLEKEKADIKADLIKTEDFDLHKVEGCKVSVCPVVKLAVKDESLVDDKYKSTQIVVDVKKAQEHKKLYGETPEGFEDNTYYRLTWKEENDA